MEIGDRDLGVSRIGGFSVLRLGNGDSGAPGIGVGDLGGSSGGNVVCRRFHVKSNKIHIRFFRIA